MSVVKTIELCTLSRWPVWYMSYISIRLVFFFFKALNDVLLLIGKKSKSFSWPLGACPWPSFLSPVLARELAYMACCPLPEVPPLPPPPRHLLSSPGWVLLMLPSSDSGSSISSLRRPFLTPCKRFPTTGTYCFPHICACRLPGLSPQPRRLCMSWVLRS